MKLFNNRKADEEKVEEEIISMVNEGNEQGLIHDDEVEMITNIFEFSEKEVRDVMTPRSDVVGIDKHTQWMKRSRSCWRIIIPDIRCLMMIWTI